jgi:regulator of vacuolar morphogenesis
MPYTLSIPSTTTSTDPNNKPYTVYNLTLAGPLRTQVLPKRYSDFDNLHAALTKSTSLTPPAPLPAKSWFKRTVNSPELTEERRKGLEEYVKAIEEAEDSQWRNSGVWREFLGLSPLQVGARRGSGVADVPPPPMTANAWLNLHTQLKALLHESRMQLARREQAQATVQQHEAGANAKKCLVKANTLILRLEEGLKGLQDGRAGEKLGEGEIRRRRDLLGRARKERQGLEGVLNTWVVKHPSSASNGGVGSAMATEGQKAGLFGNAIPNNTNFASANSSSSNLSRNNMPGAFPGTGPAPATSSRRVLGGPPPKETERTRELDNEGVLQMQKQIMQEQDLDVGDLQKTVHRMREMGIAINEELAVQADMLDMLDQDVDRAGGKIEIAKKRIGKIK